MNYLKHYCKLIRKAEQRAYTKKQTKKQRLYVEGHHIFPLSIFGKNNRIVYLTAREHYIAHALLEKIFIRRYGIKDIKSIKMIHAHIMLKNNGYYNSYLYENAKIRFSKSITGENNPFYGKNHTEETKEKLKIINKGKKLSEELKEKMRISRLSKNNHFYGKSHTEKTKQKMSELKKGNKNALGYKMTKEQIEKSRQKRIGKKHTEEHKKKLREQIKGRKWWNNGIETKMSFGCPGKGWVLGRLKLNLAKELMDELKSKNK